jgi:pSer/pThr/pTyr-binding forkhead associated (FHA) protein
MAGETLKITGGNAAGQTITLEQELVIGRSTPGLGSLGGDSEISRVHARVFHDPSGRLMIEDLGSTNGTFVNGNRVSGQQPLNSGDQVRVGQTSLTVEGGAVDTGATSVGQVIPAAPVPAPAAAAPPTQPLPPQAPLGGPPGGPPPGAPGPGFGGGPVGGPPQRAGGGGGQNRNLLIALAAIVVIGLIVAGLAIGGVFGGSDKKSDTNTVAQTTPTTTTSTTDTTSTSTPTDVMPSVPTTDTQSPPTSQGGYPPKIKQEFISGCSRSGKLSRSQCSCIVNKAEQQYSLAEFLAALKATQGGNAPPKLVSIIRGCAA